MPDIRDPNTVQAIAQGYMDSDKDKSKGLLAAGYCHSTAYSGGGTILYERKAVIEAIAEITQELRVKHVADKTERQEFWTNTMKTAPNMCDKLRASELLGKSECDFIDLGLTAAVDVAKPVSAEDIDEFRAMARAATKLKLSS